MSRNELSNNEKLVLYGLTRYPLDNDRQLSEKVNLKMSTITAIKNRLKTRNYYFTARIPMLNDLGCELVNIIYGRIYPMTSDEKKLELSKIINGFERFNLAALGYSAHSA